MNEWKYVDRSALALLMGVHPDTVALFVEQGMAVGQQGGGEFPRLFDAPACLAWHRARTAREIESKTLADLQRPGLITTLDVVDDRRDAFAGQVITGLLASDAHADVVLETLMSTNELIQKRADFAYRIADAMLRAREPKAALTPEQELREFHESVNRGRS